MHVFSRSKVVSFSLDHTCSMVYDNKINLTETVFYIVKDFLFSFFFQNVEDFTFMNLLLISKLLLIIFIRKVSFDFITVLHLTVLHCICSLGMDIGWMGMKLPWCDFKTFMHHLHHCQIAVNDLVCLVYVYLMFAISCRISSARG